jgi:hypothetical protein
MHIPEGLYFIKWGLKKGNRIFGPKQMKFQGSGENLLLI